MLSESSSLIVGRHLFTEFEIGSRQPTPWIPGDPNTPDGELPAPQRLLHRTWKARRRAQRHWLRAPRHAAAVPTLIEAPQSVAIWITPVVTKALSTDLELPENFVMQFDFRFDGGKVIHCSFNGKGHICRATINPLLKFVICRLQPRGRLTTLDAHDGQRPNCRKRN